MGIKIIFFRYLKENVFNHTANLNLININFFAYLYFLNISYTFIAHLFFMVISTFYQQRGTSNER